MDAGTLKGITDILSACGAWGVAGVLLWMQIGIIKNLTDALNKFTVAINLMTDGKAGS